MLILHIIAGTVVLLCALIAIIAKKGIHVHRMAGNTFFVAMLIVSMSAIYLDIVNREIPVIGVLVMYLIATSWMTVKRKEGTTGLFEKIAFIAILLVVSGLYSIGWQTMNSPESTRNGVPAAMFFVFGSIALIAALLDLLMLLRGGVSGKHRIARHLWRMCVPTIFALMSFLSQKQVIPEALHGSPVLWMPVLLLLLFMMYWLVRVLFTQWIQTNSNMIRRR